MIENIENLERYFYPKDLSRNRKDGVSAVVRCKDEAEFIIPSLLSIKDFFNEIVVILNCSTDKTWFLLNELKLPNLKIFYYDEPIIPAGPESVDVNPLSVHHIVYYTNYCFSLTNYNWVYRFDADHIALPNFYDLKNIIACDRYNSIEDRGIDLVGQNCDMLGSQEMCSFEKRLVKITPEFKYIVTPNKMAEMPNCTGLSYKVEEPTFLHVKWCAKDAGRKWTNGWQGIHHFKAIKERHDPIKSYSGPLPNILKLYLKLNKDPYQLIDLYHNGKI